jgi:hypothetical protein
MSVLTIFSPSTLSLKYRTGSLDSVATLSIFFIRACVCTSNRHLVFWWRASEYYGGPWGFLFLLFHEFFRPACGFTTISSTKTCSQFHQQWSLQINQRPKWRSRPGGEMRLLAAMVPRNKAVEPTWERVRTVTNLRTFYTRVACNVRVTKSLPVSTCTALLNVLVQSIKKSPRTFFNNIYYRLLPQISHILSRRSLNVVEGHLEAPLGRRLLHPPRSHFAP